MQIYHYKDPKLNFGDDLNEVLWPRIFGPEIYEADDVVIIGIGSILSEQFAGTFAGSGKHIIVLGSGTSYGLPPRSIAEWSVLAVRGPWTAAMIGMPETAVTDSAILLSDTPDLIARSPAPSEILFMPHHRSIRLSPWAEIAREAGLTFVSPQQPVADVLAAFGRAKLVVTEAMHGAIVADTLRIPWIPVVVSPMIDEFKWRDWTLSMDVPYAPVQVAAGAARDRRRYAKARRLLDDAGLAGHQVLAGPQSREALQSYLSRRFAPDIARALLRSGPGRAGKAMAPLIDLADPRDRARAVASLRSAAAGRSYLSTDHCFTRRLDQMREAVRSAERIAIAGR